MKLIIFLTRPRPRHMAVALAPRLWRRERRRRGGQLVRLLLSYNYDIDTWSIQRYFALSNTKNRYPSIDGIVSSLLHTQIEAANFAASQEFLVPLPSFLRQLRMWTEKVLRAKTIWLASGHTSHPKQERHHEMAALCQCLTMV